MGNSRLRQGRPKARWVDNLECGSTEWHVRAQDREAWREEERMWAVNTWIKLRGWPSLKRHVDFWEINMAAGGGIPLGFLDQVRNIFGDDSVGGKRKHEEQAESRDNRSSPGERLGEASSQIEQSGKSGKVLSDESAGMNSQGAPYPVNVRLSFDAGCLGPDNDDFPLSWLRPPPQVYNNDGRRAKNRRKM